MIEETEKLKQEIKNRALLFCVDNPRFGREFVMIETAMLIGASVALGLDENAIQLEAWQTAFGTNQLTHAEARLKKAERTARRANENKPHPNLPMPCCERPETRTSKCFIPQG